MSIFQKDSSFLYDIIDTYLKKHDTINIIISGISCSGKTTLANNIKEHFSQTYPVTIIAQDDYFKDLKNIPKTLDGYLTDSPFAFSNEEFEDDVNLLLKNGSVKMPIYDIPTNKRISKEKTVNAGKINIFEGLYTIMFLYNLPNSIKIFVNTPELFCIERRIKRDTSKYNISSRLVHSRWASCIAPQNRKWLLPQINQADILIREGE